MQPFGRNALHLPMYNCMVEALAGTMLKKPNAPVEFVSSQCLAIHHDTFESMIAAHILLSLFLNTGLTIARLWPDPQAAISPQSNLRSSSREDLGGHCPGRMSQQRMSHASAGTEDGGLQEAEAAEREQQQGMRSRALQLRAMQDQQLEELKLSILADRFVSPLRSGAPPGTRGHFCRCCRSVKEVAACLPGSTGNVLTSLACNLWVCMQGEKQAGGREAARGSCA